MPLPNILQPLFKATEWPNPGTRRQTVTIGSIITFHYIGQRPKKPIHDPYPLLLVANMFSLPDGRGLISGVNLHYLTFPYVKTLVGAFGGNIDFSYDAIRGYPYVTENAYRSYRREGVDQSTLKMLDIEFLKNLLQVVRSLNLGEIEQIRDQIKAMIENPELVQAPAQEGTEQIIR